MAKSALGTEARTNELLEEGKELLSRPQQDPISQGTISAPAVENASKINIPDRPVEEVADSIISSTPIQPEEDPNIERQKQEDTQATTSEAQELQKTISDRQAILEELGLGGIKDSFEDLLKKGAFTQEAEAKAGIGDKTTSLNEISSQLRETDLKFTRNIERIQDEPGLTSAQKNAKIGDVSRKQARELADLSVIQATRRDDLTTAQALVDRKVELTFEPIQQRLDFQTLMFNENKDLFTTAEQRQFDENLAEKQVQIDKDKFKFEQLENTKLQLLAMANQNGAGNGVLSAIQSATTVDSVFKAAGSFGRDLEKVYATQKTLEELNALQSTGDLDPSKFPEGSAERSLAWIANSADAKKQLSDGTLTEIKQIETALSGVDNLVSMLFSSAQEGEQGDLAEGFEELSTGRASGLWDNFQLKFKSDPSVAGFNAAVQGLIPTVARGIFGEVGVLTEADINNYKQTLPNITNAEDENKFITTIMLDVLSKSMESTLVNQAKAGRDVSNFSENYTVIRTKVETLKAELNNTAGNIQVSSETSDFLDGLLGNTQGSPLGASETSFKFNF